MNFESSSVAVMACDDEVIPLQDRIEKVVDETDLLVVYYTEWHAVCCLRTAQGSIVVHHC